ncbi:hypothetical protein A5645_03110 [Mycobacterium asiaticum]|nr:hypothetical protein A5645_03110 [Mycobacterium asiaticum]
MVGRSLVAQPALVIRLAHLLLVAEPLQILPRNLDRWPFGVGLPACWFGCHKPIVIARVTSG